MRRATHLILGLLGWAMLLAPAACWWISCTQADAFLWLRSGDRSIVVESRLGWLHVLILPSELTSLLPPQAVHLTGAAIPEQLLFPVEEFVEANVDTEHWPGVEWNLATDFDRAHQLAYIELRVSYAWLCVPSLLAAAWFGKRAFGYHYRRRRGLCQACGYDLRMTPNRCPECGTVVFTTAPKQSSDGC